MSDEKKVKAPAPEKKTSGRRLPVILELSFAISKLAVVLIGAVIAFISYLAGCSPLMIAIRGGAAVLVTGLIGWFIYYLIAQGSLDTINDLLEEQKELDNSNPVGNMNYRA